MKINSKVSLLSTLILIGVLLIGFTTWGLSSNAFFIMRSRNKVNNECINVESINISEYCKSGFINNECISNVGVIYTVINIKFDEIVDFHSDLIKNNSITMNVKLKQKNNGSINDFINLSYIETKGEFVTSSYLNNKKNEVISILSFENINTNVENNKINISYFFDVTNLIVDSSFEEIIYDNLINVGMTFEVIASVK